MNEVIDVVSLTLSVPEELKQRMDKFPEINWSEVARQAINERTAVLERMNKLLSKSEFTEEDALKHGDIVKDKVWKKHRGL